MTIEDSNNEQLILTSSDAEITILQLTDSGMAKFSEGEPLDITEIIDPKNGYTKVKCKVGEERQPTFDAVFDMLMDKPIIENCYYSTTDIKVIYNGEEIMYPAPIIKVTIPSNTFDHNGYLYVAKSSAKINEHFADGFKNVDYKFVKTNILYELQ